MASSVAVSVSVSLDGVLGRASLSPRDLPSADAWETDAEFVEVEAPALPLLPAAEPLAAASYADADELPATVEETTDARALPSARRGASPAPRSKPGPKAKPRAKRSL